MRQPAGGPPNRYLVYLARAPHLGKAGLVLLVVVVLAVVLVERSGAISFITAGFLAFAGLTAILFLLSLYDLAVDVLRINYRPASQTELPEPFAIASDVFQEYVRWLSPLGFVVGIIFGHYFWQ